MVADWVSGKALRPGFGSVPKNADVAGKNPRFPPNCHTTHEAGRARRAGPVSERSADGGHPGEAPHSPVPDP